MDDVISDQTIKSFRQYLGNYNVNFKGGTVKMKVSQAKFTKKLLEISDLNDIGFEISCKNNHFISQTRGNLLDDKEIYNLEEKSLLEKDD